MQKLHAKIFLKKSKNINYFRKINFFPGAELILAPSCWAPSCRRRDVGAELSGAEMTPTQEIWIIERVKKVTNNKNYLKKHKAPTFLDIARTSISCKDRFRSNSRVLHNSNFEHLDNPTHLQYLVFNFEHIFVRLCN